MWAPCTVTSRPGKRCRRRCSPTTWRRSRTRPPNWRTHHPADALLEWLADFITHFTQYRGLARAFLPVLQDTATPSADPCAGMRAAGAALLERAQQRSKPALPGRVSHLVHERGGPGSPGRRYRTRYRAGGGIGITRRHLAQYRRDGVFFRPPREAPPLVVQMIWRRQDPHPSAHAAIAMVTELYRRPHDPQATRPPCRRGHRGRSLVFRAGNPDGFVYWQLVCGYAGSCCCADRAV